jgi:hypothetical protein
MAFGALNLILAYHAKASSTAGAASDTLRKPMAAFGNRCYLWGYRAKKVNHVNGRNCT